LAPLEIDRGPLEIATLVYEQNGFVGYNWHNWFAGSIAGVLLNQICNLVKKFYLILANT